MLACAPSADHRRGKLVGGAPRRAPFSCPAVPPSRVPFVRVGKRSSLLPNPEYDLPSTVP
jgi:hypothetical protein